MKTEYLLKQLKQITLKAQGLDQSASFGIGKPAVLNTLEHLGYVQIDTLSIIARAHHHTLWTRIPDYQASFLHQLIEERSAFEYWFHAASYLPMRDYRYALPQMLSIKSRESRYYNADPKIMMNVYERIRNDGPQKARDFESLSKKKGSWWNWKPTKLALEQLFMQGDLMIAKRDGIEKVYDISERILPNTVNITPPTRLEYAAYLVKTYLHAYGFTTIKQITHLKTGKVIRADVETILDKMCEEGTVQKFAIQGLPSIYVLSDLLEQQYLESTPSLHLLSPFDNSIIHRERVKQHFDFDFRLECYTPQEKRQYGYFCLPILLGDQFIGRVDCKAHRKTGQFELIHLHIENSLIDPDLWLKPFIEKLNSLAIFNGCQTVILNKVSPSKFANAIHQLI